MESKIDKVKMESLFYLEKESSNDDHTEQFIGHEIMENVTFPVNFSCVDFVENLHQNESVEDDG